MNRTETAKKKLKCLHKILHDVSKMELKSEKLDHSEKLERSGNASVLRRIELQVFARLHHVNIHFVIHIRIVFTLTEHKTSWHIH